MTSTNDTTSDSKPFEVHKRTVPIVLLLVVIPWILLALPGSFVGKGGQSEGATQIESVHSNFGWPLVHMEKTKVDVFGRWRGGQFRPGEALPPAELEKVLDEYIASRDTDIGGATMLNLIPKVAEGQPLTSLWTNPENLPLEVRKVFDADSAEKGVRYTWKKPMFIANIVLMCLTCIFVGYLVERFSS